MPVFAHRTAPILTSTGSFPGDHPPCRFIGTAGRHDPGGICLKVSIHPTEEGALAKTKPAAPTKSAETALSQGVAEIREWHRIGCESLEVRPGAAPPRSAVLEAEATLRGIGVGRLRKLRQFADPKTGYTPSMLETLCRQCLRAKRPLGVTFLMRLVVIPDRSLRGELQKRLLEENWSCQRLNREIRMKLGRQRAGGRHARIAADLPGILVQIDGMIEPWTRLQRRMSLKASGGDPLPELPKKVREGFARAVDGLIGLRRVIQREVQAIKSREGKT